MIKLVLALGGAGLAALATVLAVALAGTGDTTATVRTFAPPAAEISGPCDEAEHAADPRCTRAAPAGQGVDDDQAAGLREAGEDVGDDRGGANEVEDRFDDHGGANELEAEDRFDDHGHHRGHGNDDRSGSSSGRG